MILLFPTHLLFPYNDALPIYSYLLSVSGNIVYDIYQNYIAGRFGRKKELSDKNYLRFSRLSLIGVGILAYILGKRSEEHTSELQSRGHLVCRLVLEHINALSV